MLNEPTHPNHDRLELGPDSLLWRWAGDMRIAFEGGTAGLLQTMHPAIGQALIDHSEFFDDPVDRVFRSLPGILGTVYNGPHAAATGIQVRDFHRHIKGALPGGQRYHALTPETFWWAHATFQRMVDRIAQYWERRPLNAQQGEQLYAEGCEWYRRYGVTDTVLPADRAAFEWELDRYCRDVLQPNPASDYLIEFIGRPAIPDMSASPHYPAHPRLRPIANLLLPTLPVRAALAPPDAVGNLRRPANQCARALRHHVDQPRRARLPRHPVDRCQNLAIRAGVTAMACDSPRGLASPDGHSATPPWSESLTVAS